MKNKKGFSLIELIIVVAIIGILSLISIPMYNEYIVRVENMRVFADMSYIARKIQTDILSGGDLGGSEYSADNLLKLAPNPTTSQNMFGCAGEGFRLHRLQWHDPKSIAKILNNTTSKITTLHIETFMKDPSCRIAASNPVFQQTMFFALDYKAYGLSPPKETNVRTQADGGALFILMNTDIEYIYKDGRTNERKIDQYNFVCGISNGDGVNGLVSLTTFPINCRYFITTVNGAKRILTQL